MDRVQFPMFAGQTISDLRFKKDRVHTGLSVKASFEEWLVQQQYDGSKVKCERLRKGTYYQDHFHFVFQTLRNTTIVIDDF